MHVETVLLRQTDEAPGAPHFAPHFCFSIFSRAIWASMSANSV